MHNITLILANAQVSNDTRQKAANFDDLSDATIVESDLFRKISSKPIQLSFVPTKEMSIDLATFYDYFKLSDQEIKYVQNAGPLRSIVRIDISLTGLKITLDL